MITRARAGMALVPIIAIVSFVALLAVATLSVSTRLEQGGSLAARDARLDAAASFALNSVVVSWRSNQLGALPVGETRSFGIPILASPIAASVSVTRTTSELFWVVGEASAPDGSVRRQNLVLALRRPVVDSAAPVIAGGDVAGTGLTVAHDTGGCAPTAPDLIVAVAAAVAAPASVVVSRSPLASDTSYLARVGNVTLAEMMTSPDSVLYGGLAIFAPFGVVRVSGDLTLNSSVGGGILFVDGTLTIVGPVAYTGVIVARQVRVTGPGVSVIGALRVIGPTTGGAVADFGNAMTITASACAIRQALVAGTLPHPVKGRSWAELY